MRDFSSLCYIVSAALGIAGYWQPKLVGPAVAFIGLGLLLLGR